MNNLELKKIANDVRKGIVASVHSAKAGHPGGSLSAADLYTYLYFEEMNIDPAEPNKADRDRFVLSKGHTAPGLYAALANRVGELKDVNVRNALLFNVLKYAWSLCLNPNVNTVLSVDEAHVLLGSQNELGAEFLAQVQRRAKRDKPILLFLELVVGFANLVLRLNLS